MSAKTALVAAGPLVAEGAAFIEQGDSYYTQAGACFLKAREAAGYSGKGALPIAYKTLLHKAGVAERTEQHAIRMVSVPNALETYREKDRSQKRAKRAQDSCAVPPSAIKDLALREVSPPTFLQGEIHEAVQHWKAYTARSLKAMDAKRLDDYRAYSARRVREAGGSYHPANRDRDDPGSNRGATEMVNLSKELATIEAEYAAAVQRLEAERTKAADAARQRDQAQKAEEQARLPSAVIRVAEEAILQDGHRIGGINP